MFDSYAYFRSARSLKSDAMKFAIAIAIVAGGAPSALAGEPSAGKGSSSDSDKVPTVADDPNATRADETKEDLTKVNGADDSAVVTGRGTDTTHGRLLGDLSIVLGAGATVGPRSPRGTADLRFRYLDVLGIFGTYENGFGAHDAEPLEVIATGIEVRPLFMGRWLKGFESGPAFGDLLLDSIGLELGAAFQRAHGGDFNGHPALQLGLGVEVPLFVRAEGLWLGIHGGARFGENSFAAADVERPLDRAAFLGLTVAYHVYANAHLVDVGDRRVARTQSQAQTHRLE